MVHWWVKFSFGPLGCPFAPVGEQARRASCRDWDDDAVAVYGIHGQHRIDAFVL